MSYDLIILLSDYHNSCWPETEGVSAVSFPAFLVSGSWFSRTLAAEIRFLPRNRERKPHLRDRQTNSSPAQRLGRWPIRGVNSNNIT